MIGRSKSPISLPKHSKHIYNPNIPLLRHLYVRIGKCPNIQMGSTQLCLTQLETVHPHKGCCQTQSESADDVRGQSSSDTGIQLRASGTVQCRVKPG